MHGIDKTMDNLSQALMLAIRVHAGQTDKQGEPYLLHVLRVVEAVDSERAKVLAALHDVLEDNNRLDLDLEAMFDDGMWVENSVEALTRDPSDTYQEYIEGIRAGHSSTWTSEIREVKVADLRDNLGRIPCKPHIQSNWIREWFGLKRRYEKSLKILES